jgi:hypothetical protein
MICGRAIIAGVRFPDLPWLKLRDPSKQRPRRVAKTELTRTLHERQPTRFREHKAEAFAVEPLAVVLIDAIDDVHDPDNAGSGTTTAA